MTTSRQLHYPYEEYVQTLEMSTIKLEYCDGQIYAMAGGTPAHAELGAATICALGGAVRGNARVFASTLNVHVESTGLATFPDVTVIRGEHRMSPHVANAVVNPTILVEVTSQSTENYDRGAKLGHYKQIPSLTAVLIISHRRREVTVVERDGTQWVGTEYRPSEIVRLRDFEVGISVDALYDGIELDPAS
jgi:Uma2 family endonuclease